MSRGPRIQKRKRTGPSPREEIDEGEDEENVEDALEDRYAFPSDPDPGVAAVGLVTTDVLVILMSHEFVVWLGSAFAVSYLPTSYCCPSLL